MERKRNQNFAPPCCHFFSKFMREHAELSNQFEKRINPPHVHSPCCSCCCACLTSSPKSSSEYENVKKNRKSKGHNCQHIEQPFHGAPFVMPYSRYVFHPAHVHSPRRSRGSLRTSSFSSSGYEKVKDTRRSKIQHQHKEQPAAFHHGAHVDSPCYSSCSSRSSSDASSSGYEDEDNEIEYDYDESSFLVGTKLVPKKVFVGGLDKDYPEADIRAYFEKYGKIESVELVYNTDTYERRAFCYVTFETEDGCEAACKQYKQKIGNKECSVRKAYEKNPRMAGHSYPGAHECGVGYNLVPKKVYVRGLDKDYPEADIIAYFEKYGEVHSVDLPYDTSKNERREFCFVYFQTEESYEAALKQSKQMIGNKECDVRKAFKRDPRLARLRHLKYLGVTYESSDEESSAEEPPEESSSKSAESSDSEDEKQSLAEFQNPSSSNIMEKREKVGRVYRTTEAENHEEYMKFLYGNESNVITEQERKMEINFERLCDELKPVVWPVKKNCL